MKKPGFYPALWGCFLLGSAGLLWYWSYALPGSGACRSATCVDVPYLAPTMLSVSGAAALASGLLLAMRRIGGIDVSRRTVVEQSMTTVVVAAGVVLVALGGAVGSWMVWIGVGVAVFGAAGLIRERLAIARLRRRGTPP